MYDYDVIGELPNHNGTEIGVSVFPIEVAESYLDALHRGGFFVLSLEIEARSVARAVTPKRSPDAIALLADFGRARTGFALIKSGVPIFTTTVAVGGDALTRVIMQELSMNEADAEVYKNEEGIIAKGPEKTKALSAMQATVNSLADEIARHFHYWDTRRGEEGNHLSHVEKVTLVGGNANIKGLTDFIAASVHAETHRGNVWENVCSFDEYIPPMAVHQSLEYATAIGLALRGV